ncbi:hypothetical protein L596_016520 [Steinernema carpocapsae]|uniref:Uncharacterized protein n=1 Tax=Steinernema carpocapsae TaxID=34508 RepID=A0A4V6A3F0_STECR|nr:hypothetical protein L596_016520 [Steinernema carpocapsae]
MKSRFKPTNPLILDLALSDLLTSVNVVDQVRICLTDLHVNIRAFRILSSAACRDEFLALWPCRRIERRRLPCVGCCLRTSLILKLFS